MLTSGFSDLSIRCINSINSTAPTLSILTGWSGAFALGRRDFVFANDRPASNLFEKMLKFCPQDEILPWRLFPLKLMAGDVLHSDFRLEHLFHPGAAPAWSYDGVAQRVRKNAEARQSGNSAKMFCLEKTAFFEASNLLPAFR